MTISCHQIKLISKVNFHKDLELMWLNRSTYLKNYWNYCVSKWTKGSNLSFRFDALSYKSWYNLKTSTSSVCIVRIRVSTFTAGSAHGVTFLPMLNISKAWDFLVTKLLCAHLSTYPQKNFKIDSLTLWVQTILFHDADEDLKSCFM